MIRAVLLAAALIGTVDRLCSAQSTLAQRLRGLDSRVLADDEREAAADMLQRDILRRRESANLQNRMEWNAIDDREAWEAYRDERLSRLKRSLGQFPIVPNDLPTETTGAFTGDRFRVENLLYESRPGNWVSGNLYAPDPPRESMPGLLIVSAHHTAKTHGELQDMGMTWARAGCLVLVIDEVGYGERRAHPFHTSDDYPGEFRVSRQDYYHRYDSGLQLSLAGDSLMGWFVWDLMRGVDLLLARDGIDAQRIIILGSVAGGGDPCAITAALDDRIAAAVPFNFGGLQPESYPLPENAEETFNFAMSSYWDSTRGLPRTCSDGFFHWTIVGGIAPRPLIYAHEFMWDREHDPVWKRFQRIYGDFYDAGDHLAFAVGKGSVRESSDVATHCTHIGRYHRQFIHPAFERWFGIHVTPEDEYTNRVGSEELRCLTDAVRRGLAPLSLPELGAATGVARVAAMREQLASLSPTKRRQALREAWNTNLGPIEPQAPTLISAVVDDVEIDAVRVERLVLQTGAGIVVPIVLLTPKGAGPFPIVVGLAQSGKQAFLEQRSEKLSRLLEAGCAVCLPDLRGTGETSDGSDRGRAGAATNYSVNLQMFGETLVGQRLRDVRAVLTYLRSRSEVDSERIALWGENFAPVNLPGATLVVPHGVDPRPVGPEPLGGLLALLTALYDDEIHAVCLHRGLLSYLSVFESPQVLVPHDAVVPQSLNAGDLMDVVAALGPTPILLTAPVDALGRSVSTSRVEQGVSEAMPRVRSADHVTVSEDQDPVAWLISALQDTDR